MIETRKISSAMYDLAKTLPVDDANTIASCTEAALRLDEQTVQINLLKQQISETELALVDLWKSFTPPTTKEKQIAAMDKHKAVIRRIIEKK